ncbi:MAG TPA: methylmalonyl-CoA mutase, partial [Gemmatimonadetes bacterium]|nr:methylmalonyl-CoA mutase [Gemmatimonadota bacterium]
MSTIEKEASGSSELLVLLREQEAELSELRERLSRWEQSYAQAQERDSLFSTVSGREIKPLYTPLDRSASQYQDALGFPGEYPFTRGPYSTMYRTRLW